MIAPTRVASARRLAAAPAILGGATFVSGQPAKAQVAPAPGVAAPGSPVPVELAINIPDSQVLCKPERMRLPAYDAISLRLINESAGPIMFAAPEFLQASRDMRTEGVASTRTGVVSW